MAKANRSKAAQAAQGANVTGRTQIIGVAHVEDLKRRLSQALAVAILAASNNATDEETHRDAATVIVEILMRSISDLSELEARVRESARNGAKR